MLTSLSRLDQLAPTTTLAEQAKIEKDRRRAASVVVKRFPSSRRALRGLEASINDQPAANSSFHRFARKG